MAERELRPTRLLGRGYWDLVRADFQISDLPMSKKKKPNSHQLITAVNRRDVNLLQRYLADGADINMVLNFADGNIALLNYAAGCQFLEGVRLLLKQGADPNRGASSEAGQEGLGATALQEVINGDDTHVVEGDQEKRYEIVDMLLRAGADISAVAGVDSLYGAACRGFFKICKRLIEAGAWVKKVPEGCMPPLFGAVYNCMEPENRDNVVNLLIERGAAIDAETPWGATPLMAAARRAVENLVNLFLERGADPNRQTKNNGRTPLIDAALYFRYDAFDEQRQQRALSVVKRLLKAGANPDIRNKEGESAFDIALLGKSSLVADYIKNCTGNRK